MKKKYSLFKVLLIVLLAVIVLSYAIVGRTGERSYIALGDVIINYLQSFQYFYDTALFVLAVGGFYGVLNRVPAYKEILKRIAKKMKGNSKLFIGITVGVMALISALTGLNIILFLLVPALISIILLMGYDKLVAISATIGSIIIGLIGGVFVTFKDPSNYYSISYTTMGEFVGLEGVFANIIPLLVLLMGGIALLVLYIFNHIKKVRNDEVSYSLTKGDVLFIEVKDKNGKVKEETTGKKVTIWPVIVVFAVLLVLLILGYTPWDSLFKWDIFNKFHAWIMGLKIGNFAIFNNIISSNMINYGAFGAWGGLGNYMVALMLVIIATIVIALIGRIKFDDAMDAFIYGIKKMIPSVLIIMLAYAILVCTLNNGFIETIITFVNNNLKDNFILTLTDEVFNLGWASSDIFVNITDAICQGINIFIHSLITLLGSLLNVDLYYTSSSVFSTISSNLIEGTNLAMYATMFQGFYGFVQLVGPTSILLIVGLTYLEVPYKTWLKYIWRLLIALLILILLVLMIASLL